MATLVLSHTVTAMAKVAGSKEIRVHSMGFGAGEERWGETCTESGVTETVLCLGLHGESGCQVRLGPGAAVLSQLSAGLASLRQAGTQDSPGIHPVSRKPPWARGTSPNPVLGNWGSKVSVPLESTMRPAPPHSQGQKAEGARSWALSRWPLALQFERTGTSVLL